jgi:antitoxin StbD
MQHILASTTASISELKMHPSEIIENAQGEPIAILNRNRPVVYMISSELFEKFLDTVDELELLKIVKKRLEDKHKAIEVSLDDL